MFFCPIFPHCVVVNRAEICWYKSTLIEDFAALKFLRFFASFMAFGLVFVISKEFSVKLDWEEEERIIIPMTWFQQWSKNWVAVGSLLGYRQMHSTPYYGMIVDRETICRILVILDPNGVRERARQKLRRWQYLSKGPIKYGTLMATISLSHLGFAYMER